MTPAFVPVAAPPLLRAPRRRRCRRPARCPALCAQRPAPAPHDGRSFDVAVIGAGPAGLALAAALGARRLRVLCADAQLQRGWPNNYGTWLHDLRELQLHDCVSHVWPRTAAFVRPDGTKCVLPRAYARVDRHKLKSRLLHNCHRSGNVTLVPSAVHSLDLRRPDLNLLHLDRPAHDPAARTVAARLVVDATGHSLAFVKVPDGATPGYQAAYGIECIVSENGYPYDSNEMLLMDFRDDHMQTAQDKQNSNQQPTFIYVMPMDSGKGRHVFFEETSLVASPAMSFDLLKERLYSYNFV